MFIDERVFTVDRKVNSRNDRVIQLKDVPAGTRKLCRTKHPSSITICCAVGDDGGKAPLHVVPKWQAVNSEYYMQISKETVIPCANKRYGAMNWVRVQDNVYVM